MRLDNERAAGWFRSACAALRSAHVAALLLGAMLAFPASAEVRFGPGVRTGGHDFSNWRYGSVHIRRVSRLPGPPGCRHVRNGFYRRGDGSVVRGPMERCNLVAIPPARRR